IDHGQQVADVLPRRQLGHDAAVGTVHRVLRGDHGGEQAAVAHDGRRRIVARALDAEDGHSPDGFTARKIVLSPRRTRNRTLFPLPTAAIALRYAATSFTGCRFTSRMTSPRLRPASPAGPSGSTWVTTTPFSPRSTPRVSASSGVRVCTVSPRSSLVPEPPW